MSKDFAGFVVAGLLLGALVALPLAAQEKTAWDEMIEADPSAGEDESISPLERVILNALSPEQALAYQGGADPSTIRLATGETLAELIAARLMGGGPELVYVPVTPCRVFATWFTGSPGVAMAANEIRTLFARGADLSAQGGSATGCGIPAEAVAIAAQVRPSSPVGQGFVKAWPVGGVETPTPLADYDPANGVDRYNSATILEICTGMCAGGDFRVKTARGGSHVRIDTTGFFKPIVPGSGGGLDADFLDGLDSTDFAPVVHTHDGGDITSGTVGEPYIDPLIARDDEVVDIVKAADGAGSGLDADLLDGLDSTDLLLQVGNCLTVSPSCPAVAADALAALCWQTISAALAAINGTDLPLAGAANRYLIKVGPGIYDDQVFMTQYVDIEGSGQKVTTIRWAHFPVTTNDNVELRNLSVEAIGPNGSQVSAVLIGGTPTLKHVTVRSSGGDDSNIGVLATSSSAPILDHVTVINSGEAAFDVAAAIQLSSTATIRNSVLDGDAAAQVSSGSSANIVGTQLVGSAVVGGGGGTLVCLGAYDAAFTELGTDCQP